MLDSAIGRLRLIALIEGVSYLVLLVFTVLKRTADPVDGAVGSAAPWALAVRITGSLHGVLFLLFCAALLHAWVVHRWSFGRALVLFIASLLPFGTFFTDRWLAGMSARASAS